MRSYNFLRQYCNHALYDFMLPQLGGTPSSPINRNFIPGAVSNPLLLGTTSYIPKWNGDHTRLGPQDDSNSWLMCTNNIANNPTYFFHVARVRVVSFYLFRGRDGFGSGWSMYGVLGTGGLEFTRINSTPSQHTCSNTVPKQAGRWYTCFIAYSATNAPGMWVGVGEEGGWTNTFVSTGNLRSSTVGLGFNRWNAGILDANMRIWGCGVLSALPSNGVLQAIHREILTLEEQSLTGRHNLILAAGSPPVGGSNLIASPITIFS